MPSLNLDLDYFRNPRTLRLRSKLGAGAELLPLELWCHCARYHPEDGRLEGYAAQEAESACGWTGAPGEAVRALMETGFLAREENGTLFVPGWLEEQGHIAAFKKRGRDAARKRWDSIKNQYDAPKRDGFPADAASIAAGSAQNNPSGDACGIAAANAPAKPSVPADRPAFTQNKSMAPESAENKSMGNAMDTKAGAPPNAAVSGAKLKLVQCYKNFRGIKTGQGWDAQNLERNLRAAESLLYAFKGELQPAARWMCVFGERMDRGGLHWTLDTAARHAWDCGPQNRPPG